MSKIDPSDPPNLDPPTLKSVQRRSDLQGKYHTPNSWLTKEEWQELTNLKLQEHMWSGDVLNEHPANWLKRVRLELRNGVDKTLVGDPKE